MWKIINIRNSIKTNIYKSYIFNIKKKFFFCNIKEQEFLTKQLKKDFNLTFSNLSWKNNLQNVDDKINSSILEDLFFYAKEDNIEKLKKIVENIQNHGKHLLF